MVFRFVRRAVFAALICASSPARADEGALRESVRRALADPGVFVYNPPAELGAYSYLSREELEARQEAALGSGAILVLFPNGLPMKLESHKDFLPHGAFKSWYADGTPQVEETFAGGKLVQGKYFSADGKLIAEVRDGRGKRVEFHLGEDGRSFVPQTETGYVDGLKEGKEISYSLRGDGRVLGETQYRKGVKDGLNKAWALDGQLTVQESYAEGRKHGDSLYWHDNGNVLFTAQYDHGVQVGASSRYAKDGQKREEAFRDGKDLLLEMQWYPEGAMMVCKKYDPATHRLAEAWSFDRTGAVNGTVQDGRGKLVVCEDPGGRMDGPESFVLEQYVGGNSPNLLELPTLQWNSAQRDKDVLKIRFRVEKIPGFDELSARIEPPVPGSEPVEVQLKSANKKGVPATLIPVPAGTEHWSVYALCTAKGKLGTFSFTQMVYAAGK